MKHFCNGKGVSATDERCRKSSLQQNHRQFQVQVQDRMSIEKLLIDKGEKYESI